MNLYDLNYPFSFNFTICKLVFFAFYAQRNEYDIYLDYLEAIQKHEQKISKNNPQIIDLFIYCLYFVQFFYHLHQNQVYYLILKIAKRKLIKRSCMLELKDFFYMPEDKFEKQKKLFDEGVNPNEIAKIIRNDEIEKLQEISSQNDFNFKQTIVPSPYERCDFINQSYVTLIDYAAFFSSIKCFKYLLMNGANVKNTGKYAVAGGNEEIIHLCEQNHSSFEDAFETAIQFHRNNIFKYLYENKIENINVFSITLLCITYMNYDIFSYMVKEGMEINNEIINVIASLGDFFIIQQFVENNQIPKDLLISSAMSKNLELVKYVLKQKGIDINYNNQGTALYWATKYDNTHIVKFLLEQKGIDINAITEYKIKSKYVGDCDYEGCEYHKATALHLAVQRNNLEIVKLLLNQNGIDVNAIYEYKKDELFDDCEIIYDNDKCTALHLAIRDKDLDIVKLLLNQNSINVNAIYESKYKWRYYYEERYRKYQYDKGTALHMAINANDMDIFKLLLNKNGIDINIIYKEVDQDKMCFCNLKLALMI